MRRSTAAAFGTLTGAALIVGVRLSVAAPVASAAPPPTIDLNANDSTDTPSTGKPSKSRTKTPPKQDENSGGEAGGEETGLKNGVYKGKSADYAYGAIQVAIKIRDGKIVAADATYPVESESATINPPAIAQLKQQTLKASSAKDIDTVSGATLTSGAYRKSLQAALDAAGA